VYYTPATRESSCTSTGERHRPSARNILLTITYRCANLHLLSVAIAPSYIHAKQSLYGSESVNNQYYVYSPLRCTRRHSMWFVSQLLLSSTFPFTDTVSLFEVLSPTTSALQQTSEPSLYTHFLTPSYRSATRREVESANTVLEIDEEAQCGI
jgi:hypothetical protein